MLHRLGARRDLLVTLAVMTLLFVFAITGSRALLASTVHTALEETIASAPGDERVILLQTRLADAQQADAGTELISAALPGSVIHQSVRTPPLPVKEFDGERLTLTTGPQIPDEAELLDGTWPESPGEGALHQGAAEALGLVVGDEITIVAEGQESPLRVTGTWVPTDLSGTLWGQDSPSRTGVDPSAAFAYGPAVVTEDALKATPTTPFVRWLVSAKDLSTDAVRIWRSALPDLPGQMEEAGLTHRGITAAGGLEETLRQAQASLTALAAVTPIPYSLLAVIAVIALWQMFTLLRLQRRPETTIIRARGGTLRTLALWSAAEGAIIAIPAAAAGGLLGRIFGNHPSPWPVVGAVAVGVVTMAVIAGLPAVGAPRLRQVSGRAVVMLIAGAAAFTLWRLLRSGGRTLDVLSISAPALTLVAVAAIGLIAMGPLLGGLARLATHRPSLSPWFEGQLAARRGTQAGVLVLLIVLTATAGLSAAYWGTWQQLRDTSAQVSAGAQVVVSDRMSASGLAELRGLDPVESAAPVFTADYALDDDRGALTAFGPSGFTATSAPPEVLDPGLGALLSGDFFTGPTIQETEVRARVEVAAHPHTKVDFPLDDRTFTFFLLGWNGEVIERIPLGEISTVEEKQETFTAPLPPDGPWQIVAVDTMLDVRANTTDFSVEIEIPGADFSGFTPDILPGPGGEYAATAPLGFTATLTNPDGYFELPGVPRLQRSMYRDDPGPIPIAVTPGWAGPLTPTAIRVSGREVMAEPVAEIPVVPGNPSPAGVLADTGAVAQALLRTGMTTMNVDSAWVSTSDSTATAQTIGESRAEVSDSQWAALSRLMPLLFLAMSGLAVILALPAIGAAAQSELRGRRGEVAIMRAVGMRARIQAGYRRREFGLVFTLAAIIGAAAGTLLAIVLAEPLIRATTPQVSSAVPVLFAVDPLTAAAFGALIAGAGTAVVWWYGRRVGAQAHDPLWREDV